TRRAEFQALYAISVAIAPDLGAQALERGAGQGHTCDPKGQLAGYRQWRRGDSFFQRGLHRGQGTPADRVRQIEDTIKVKLRCRQVRDELGCPSEYESGTAAQPNAAILATELKFQLVERCRSRIALDVGA